MNAPKVWVLSYRNTPNFGDRLGVHLITQVLPPHAVVRHISHEPFDAPADETPDLLIVGIGNSVYARMLTDDFARLIDRVPKVVGIFGTQYREAIPADRFADLLGRLDTWFARNALDVALYGQLTPRPRHLGDWLIDAFPMAPPPTGGALKINLEDAADAPMDRYIARIQQFRRVHSARLHPLLCAMTSAETVSYSEQGMMHEGSPIPSGKFHSMLLDVFGRSHPPETPFQVDRAAVVAYKATVRTNVIGMRDALREVVG